jgi:hypothetical protein
LRWEETKISIPIKIDTHSQMEAEIQSTLADNPSAQSYYEVARYYQEQDIKPEIALLYLNKAIEIGGDTYYFHRVKSLVEARLGNYQAAIYAAKRSKDLAAKDGKDEFVRMNQKNIDRWNHIVEAQE